MEYELASLLLMRLRCLETWQNSLSSGGFNDRLERVQEEYLLIVEKAGGLVRLDPIGRWPEAFLSTFPSPTASLKAAGELARRFSGSIPGLPESGVAVGIAVNAGEITFRSGKIIGAPLDVVSRLEHMAKDGQVLFSEAVLLSIGRMASFGYRPLLEKIGMGTGPEMRAFALEEMEVLSGK